MSFSTTIHDSAGKVLDNHMSIQDAAQYSGYNVQYLRRLVRTGSIFGKKIGQIWLIELSSLERYLKSVQGASDRRFGPRVYQEFIESRNG
jgi:excisionase family DNA binding protein